MDIKIKAVRYSAFLVAMIIMLGQSTAFAGEWTVDHAHTRVGFSVTHLGINTVQGVFKKFDADVAADGSTGKLSAVSATVTVASIDTGVDARDDHLRGPDLFNVKAYPTMRLETTRITWNGNSFSGTAKLTMKDVTKQVRFKGRLVGVKTVTIRGKTEKRAGYRVTASVNREAFGLKFGAFSEGLSLVGETVDITLDAEIVKPVGD